MVKALRILIVDDQQHARRSLKALLATRFQLVDACEAVNGIEAIRCVEECKPNIVLMDARMPELDGIEATRIIKTKSPQIQVIVLSLYAEYQAAALAAGAAAFISKGEPPERLLAALTAAASATEVLKDVSTEVEAQRPRRRTLDQALGLLTTTHPAPSDAEIKQWLNERP